MWKPFYNSRFPRTTAFLQGFEDGHNGDVRSYSLNLSSSLWYEDGWKYGSEQYVNVTVPRIIDGH